MPNLSYCPLISGDAIADCTSRCGSRGRSIHILRCLANGHDIDFDIILDKNRRLRRTPSSPERRSNQIVDQFVDFGVICRPGTNLGKQLPGHARTGIYRCTFL